MSLLTVLASEAHTFGGPFEVPPVTELFEFAPFLLDGTVFAVNRTVLIMLTGTLFAILFMWLGLRKQAIVPGKLQIAAEGIVDFIRKDIAIQVIGHDGAKFVPLLVGLFLFIYFNNVWEVIPFVNFPPTSRIGVPIVLTLVVYVVYLFLGFKHQGFGYLKNVMFPPGVPKPIYILLTPIELATVFVIRPLTLALRLFANMLAGHILLTIIFLTIHAFLPNPRGFPIGIVGLIFGPLLVGFEMLIGVLQAYIFTILTAVYISSSVHVEH